MKFVITKKSSREHHQGTYGSAAITGLAMGAGSTAGTLAPAAGKNFLGFLVRAITAAGPTVADHLMSQVDPGSRDISSFPYKAGSTVSLEDADQVHVSGATRVLATGTGALDGDTALFTGISFDGNGLFYAAQTGDEVYFRLTAKPGTDADGDTIFEFTRV